MSTTTTFYVSSIADDGSVKRSGSGEWPPTGSITADTSFNVTERWWVEDYTSVNQVALFRFDTSSIPDYATIQSAKLRLNPGALGANPSDLEIVGEYYSFTPPISTTHYVFDVNGNAFSGLHPSGLTQGVYKEIVLSNVSNIVKTGYTGFRVGFLGKPAQDALESNTILWGAYGGEEAELEVTYQEGTLHPKVLTAYSDTFGELLKSTNKICSALASATGNLSLSVSKFLSAVGKVTGAIVTGSAFMKGFIARGNVIGSLEKRWYIGKVFTAISSVNGFILKVTNKILTALGKITSGIKKSSPYKLVYPKLTVTGYPVEMSITEYPLEMLATEYLVDMSIREYPLAMETIKYVVGMEVLGMAIAGSTITLIGTFPDSAGNLALLEDVSCKIFTPGKVSVTTLVPTEISTGVYSTEYTIPYNEIGDYYFEFSGVLDSKTIVGKSTFEAI